MLPAGAADFAAPRREDDDVLDLEALRAGFGAMVPFAAHVGTEFTELDGTRCVVRLPEAPHLANHLQAQHAAALFTAAETASGGSFLAVFAEVMGEVTPVVQEMTIRYRKVARGPIDAEAVFEDADGARAALASEGVARFAIPVTLRDATGDVVCEATAHWHVRRND